MNKLFDLNTYTNNYKIVGIIAILISVVTWTSEIMGWTYVCPYCRTQRTVIGLLGISLLFPNPGHWIIRYVGTVLGVLGLVVGGTQHFKGWAKISAGKFEFNDQIWFDSFLLSGAALFIITGLVFMLFLVKKTEE